MWKRCSSIKVAVKLGCKCYGIDAIHEFIDYAQKKVLEYKVKIYVHLKLVILEKR